MIWRQMGEWRYISIILDLALDGGEWSADTPQPLFPRGNSSPPRYPLYRRLGGFQGLSGRYGMEKNLAHVGNWTSVVQSVAHHYTDWAIPNNNTNNNNNLRGLLSVGPFGLENLFDHLFIGLLWFPFPRKWYCQSCVGVTAKQYSKSNNNDDNKLIIMKFLYILKQQSNDEMKAPTLPHSGLP
jgi:hypothetical protein